jgi:hypothetical protein
MKSSAGIILFVIVFLINPLTHAQGQAALPFLAFPVSPVNAGMGSVGTALPSDNVYGFLYNPAQLGYSSRSTNFGLQFYLKKPEVGKKTLDPYYLAKINSIAFNAGYRLDSLLKIPVSVGISYAGTDFSLPYIYTQNFFEEKDAYNAYSIGIGLNYFINFSAGITYKSITSELSNEFSEDQLKLKDSDGEEGVGAIDFGMLLNIPLLDLAFKEFKKKMTNSLNMIPSLDFSLGYSQSNIGDKVFYIDRAQADPLPRIARAGYGVSAGVRLSKKIYDIELFHIDFASEAEDYLIVRDFTGATSYQSGFGDIRLGRNILGIKGDEDVYAHAGLKLSLLESVEFMWGHFGNQTFLGKTRGLALRVKGLFSYLSDQRNNGMMNFIADHIDIRYYDTKYLVDAPQETSFRAIELVFSNYLF